MLRQILKMPKICKNSLSRDKNGVAAIEFALLFLPFFVFFTILLEILLLVYKSVALDFVNSAAAKYASSFSYEQNYVAKYDEYISSRQKNLLFFLRGGDFSRHLAFCKSVHEAAKNTCTGANDDNLIVIYEISHEISPLILGNWIDGGRKITSRVAYFSERRKIHEKPTAP